jgi:hypothetical protein
MNKGRLATTCSDSYFVTDRSEGILGWQRPIGSGEGCSARVDVIQS